MNSLTYLPKKPLTNIWNNKWIQRAILLWSKPKWSFLFATIFYSIIAIYHNPIWQTSEFPYYNYLADAFLHGQLSLRIIPKYTLDLVLFNGKYYLYWPPMPAILLMPFVRLFGIGVSDIIYSILIGGINVGLVALLLRSYSQSGYAQLSNNRLALLVIFFAFGTVHMALPSFSQVWFTALLLGLCFVALTYLIALRLHGWKAFLLAGFSLACAILTRNHLILTGVWPLYFLLKQHRNLSKQKLFRNILLFIAPIGIALGFFALYNWLRFGSFFEIGLDYHLMSTFFVDDYKKYGPFNLHYLPINFYYQYIFYPLPFRETSVMGGSLFLLSPVFFAAFIAIKKGQPRWSILALGITIILVDIPILLLMGTGWVQWGPRYTLDFTVPLLLLTATGICHIPKKAVGFTYNNLNHPLPGWGYRIPYRLITHVRMDEQLIINSTDYRYSQKLDPWSSHSLIISRLRSCLPGTKVLDVGTADGTLGHACQEMNLLFHGIEPNQEWAKTARPFYDLLWVTTLEDIPDRCLKDFQLIVCADVLEHLTDPERAFKRLVNLQNQGAVFIISVPNIANIWIRLNLLIGRFDYSEKGILDRTHLRFFTRYTILKMIDQTGLSLRHIDVTPIPMNLIHPFFETTRLGFWIHRSLAQLTRVFPTLLGYQFIIEAEK